MHLRLDTRAVEALLTVLLLNIGMIYLSTGNTFDLPHYRGLGNIIEDWALGLILIGFGAVRWISVMFTNGSSVFQFLRMIGAILGISYWLIIVFVTWLEVGDIIATMFAVATSCVIFEFFVVLRVWRDYRHGTVVVVVEKDAL